MKKIVIEAKSNKKIFRPIRAFFLYCKMLYFGGLVTLDVFEWFYIQGLVITFLLAYKELGFSPPRFEFHFDRS